MTRVYTLCGSSRFPDAFALANAHLSAQGHIVIGLGMFGHTDEPAGAAHLVAQPGMKANLDWLHRKKIDMSDAIYVVNVGGYIGTSTYGEIEYARRWGKAVEWMFPDAIPMELAEVS